MAGTGLMLEMIENERLCKLLAFFSNKICASNSIAIFTKDEKNTSKILFQPHLKNSYSDSFTPKILL